MKFLIYEPYQLINIEEIEQMDKLANPSDKKYPYKVILKSGRTFTCAESLAKEIIGVIRNEVKPYAERELIKELKEMARTMRLNYQDLRKIRKAEADFWAKKMPMTLGEMIVPEATTRIIVDAANQPKPKDEK